MLKQTKLLKAKLEESRRSGYQIPISPLRPGQESIMVVRPWAPEERSLEFQNERSIRKS